MPTIQPLGIPYDLQHYNKRMGRAPALLLPRLAELNDERLRPPLTLPDLPVPDDDVSAIATVHAAAAQRVGEIRAQGQLPLLIGGDCLVPLGAMSGLQRAPNQPPGGLLWLDAHGDFNSPETTPSGYIGGMPLAVIAGRALPELRSDVGLEVPFSEERIALVGVRDLDPLERAALDASSVAVMTTEQVRSPAGQAPLAALLERLAAAGPVHLHLDVDLLDPVELPGLVYPAPGGLQLIELQALLEQVAAQVRLAAVSLSALNPEPGLSQADRMLEVALALLGTLLASLD